MTLKIKSQLKYKMPSGKLVKVEEDEDFKPREFDILSDSSSEEEFDKEKYENLLGKKKEPTIMEIIEILIDKGGISVGNILGIQKIMGLIDKVPEEEQGEMGSCLNLIIILANLYLKHMEGQRIKK
jgi:hypothetical protein